MNLNKRELARLRALVKDYKDVDLSSMTTNWDCMGCDMSCSGSCSRTCQWSCISSCQGGCSDGCQNSCKYACQGFGAQRGRW